MLRPLQQQRLCTDVYKEDFQHAEDQLVAVMHGKQAIVSLLSWQVIAHDTLLLTCQHVLQAVACLMKESLHFLQGIGRVSAPADHASQLRLNSYS